MLYGSTKALAVAGRVRYRAAVRWAAGAITLLVAAAVALVGASPVSAGSHPLKPRTNVTARALISGALLNHGGPVENAPQVYVDFWGWTSDPSGEQPYLTNFLASVGPTTWMSTVNQYGGGSPVLAGTWSDSATVPSSPSDAQIQAEAVNAAAHFASGNSVNVEIVVATPTGHSTPGFGTQWCAYHDAVSADPNITYTNLPYNTDAGTNCGEGSVNYPGTLDGVSLVEGKELANTITDPLINAWSDANGYEIADKCFGTDNISTSHGIFPVPPLWSNAAGRCV